MFPGYFLSLFIPLVFSSFPAIVHSSEPTPPPGEKSAPGKVEKAPSKESPENGAAFARRLWAITELVLANHIEPPEQERFTNSPSG